MKYANAFTKDFLLADDILSIGAEAKRAKLENPNVIDATIGALLDDDGKLLAFSVIEDVRLSLDSQKLRAYPPVDGGKPFQDAVRNWVFKDKRAALENHFHMVSLATPGASGALSNLLSNYTTKDDCVLIPDIHWSNYQAIIAQTLSTYDTYTMFKGNQFNLEGFIEKTTNVAETHKKIVVLINDPSQNPTGYSLTKTELKGIIKHLDQLAKQVPVIMIYDIAYLDYADTHYEDTRKRFETFLDVSSNMLMAVCFSASKTFSVYGLRGGALIGLTRSESVMDEFKRISLYKARSTWSCPPTTPIMLLNAIDQDEALRETFISELKLVRQMLIDRGHHFVSLASKCGLETLPYTQGFFITIPAKDPQKTYQLLKKDHIFVIPLSNAVRVALSAVSMNQINGLPEKIKQYL